MIYELTTSECVSATRLMHLLVDPKSEKKHLLYQRRNMRISGWDPVLPSEGYTSKIDAYDSSAKVRCGQQIGVEIPQVYRLAQEKSAHSRSGVLQYMVVDGQCEGCLEAPVPFTNWEASSSKSQTDSIPQKMRMYNLYLSDFRLRCKTNFGRGRGSPS